MNNILFTDIINENIFGRQYIGTKTINYETKNPQILTHIIFSVHTTITLQVSDWFPLKHRYIGYNVSLYICLIIIEKN